MSSLVPLSFHPPFLHLNSQSCFPSKSFPLSSSSSHSPSRLFLCFSSSSNSSSFDREESRWLREEQRWLREEQRWLREEQRWLNERESLLRRIAELELQIQALESRNSAQGATVSETISTIGALLQVLKEKNRIAESGESARELVLEEVKEKEVVVVEEEEEEEGIRVLESKEREEEEEKKIERKALRVGSEGDQVREMQEALQKLGFYSGEEDMEFSSFSTGTERAVKTWQASLGAREDGIMTVELLQRLFTTGQQVSSSSSSNVAANDETVSPLNVPRKEGTNGAAVASLTEISEIQQKVVKEEGFTETEVSQHRVYLLGENRWEEPSRLSGRDKQVTESKAKDSTTKCYACRGDGRLMCLECDGTGEPNVEPQFLEWVDEGANCPYCDGLGYTTCDVCQGKAVV